ncbi:MAG: undecaprenyl-diphosphate phosphatase [Candidatus Komeilibacteria bacterium]
MNTLYIIISGIIQALTEFLPISSSGHLVIWHNIISSPVNALDLDIILHLGSVLALIVFFRKDIIKILKEWFISFSGKVTAYSRLGWLLILSTIPAGLVGFFAEDIITNIFRSMYWVIAMLIIVSFIFIIVEKKIKTNNDVFTIGIKEAIYIGLAQCLALIPGTSRSGITIVTGMLCKLKRAEAARYSFLLAIPIILGASIRGLMMIASQGTTSSSMIMLGTGLFISFIFSFFVIKFLLQFLNNHSLKVFAYYRLALALVLIILLTVGVI